MLSHLTNSFVWKHSQHSEWISQHDDMPCSCTFFRISSPCYALWQVLSDRFLFTCTKPLLKFTCLHHITWSPSPFPLREPCSDCLEVFSTSKSSSLTLLFFSSYGHWICEMWTCHGVANSTEMPSVWFAALFPIMLSHPFVLLSTEHH